MDRYAIKRSFLYSVTGGILFGVLIQSVLDMSGAFLFFIGASVYYASLGFADALKDVDNNKPVRDGMYVADIVKRFGN